MRVTEKRIYEISEGCMVSHPHLSGMAARAIKIALEEERQNRIKLPSAKLIEKYLECNQNSRCLDDEGDRRAAAEGLFEFIEAFVNSSDQPSLELRKREDDASR